MPYIGSSPSQVAFLVDTFSGNGSTTAFTTSVAPANTASVLVAISGVVQDPSTYSVSGTTLTFSAAPPSGTGNISARYLGIPASGVTTTAYRTITEFTATAGQTTFTPPSYTVGFIQVYRNGVLLGSADYTATNGTTVVLTTGATAGDLITTISFYVSSVLNAIPATAGSVGQTYLANNSVGANQLQSSGAGAIAGCRAWVKFQGGTGNTAGVILSSFNVSSVTLTSTGRYRVNFINAMPSADYAILVNTSFANGTTINVFANNDSDVIPTASSFGVCVITPGTGYASSTYVYAAVFA